MPLIPLIVTAAIVVVATASPVGFLLAGPLGAVIAPVGLAAVCMTIVRVVAGSTSAPSRKYDRTPITLEGSVLDLGWKPGRTERVNMTVDLDDVASVEVQPFDGRGNLSHVTFYGPPDHNGRSWRRGWTTTSRLDHSSPEVREVIQRMVLETASRMSTSDSAR